MAGQSEDFLEHYGVKGMKWGKRKGGLISRAQGALIDGNQRNTAIARRAVEGRSTREERIANAPFKLLMGKKNFEKSAKRRLEDLENQKVRIETGKMTIMDMLEAQQSITVIDLAVSRRDNKG